jgi:hypothetical protein
MFLPIIYVGLLLFTSSNMEALAAAGASERLIKDEIYTGKFWTDFYKSDLCYGILNS